MSRNVPVKTGILARYGTIGEVARFANAAGVSLRRGERVVLRSHRGVELGTLLEDAPAVAKRDDEPDDLCILRASNGDDERTADQLRSECEQQFAAWRRRIDEWALRVELIDLEQTLDKSKLILYVLNDRGPECTRLALQAAAAGLGIVEVQPVGPDGLIVTSPRGGCGAEGCGSGDCGSERSGSDRSGASGCCH